MHTVDFQIEKFIFGFTKIFGFQKTPLKTQDNISLDWYTQKMLLIRFFSCDSPGQLLVNYTDRFNVSTSLDYFNNFFCFQA